MPLVGNAQFLPGLSAMIRRCSTCLAFVRAGEEHNHPKPSGVKSSPQKEAAKASVGNEPESHIVQPDEELEKANYERDWGNIRECPNDTPVVYWGILANGVWVGYCRCCGRWVGRAGAADVRLHSHLVWSAWIDSVGAQANRTAPNEDSADAYFERMIQAAMPDGPFWSRPVRQEPQWQHAHVKTGAVPRVMRP